MAYIAAVLLMHMKEEDAFWSFLALMESDKHLNGFYSRRLEKIRQVSEYLCVCVCVCLCVCVCMCVYVCVCDV